MSTRNFSIIAHIDHGKSTLADRIIDLAACVFLRKSQKVDQMLDSMPLERERGITIKAQTVRLSYKGDVLNMVDTPGHVDFSYEVSRALYACEGVILLVDAAQGVQAQTLAHMDQVHELGLSIVPVLNKIDLPIARPEEVKEDMHKLLGIDKASVLSISAKTGEGVPQLLEQLMHSIPDATKRSFREIKGEDDLLALLVDSWYDAYMGVVVMVRVFAGTISKGQKVIFLSENKAFVVERVGYFYPKMTACDRLQSGDIGFITANIRNVKDTKIGDTIAMRDMEPLPGFQPSQPVVFCGMFPVEHKKFDELRTAIEKLGLNDSSFTFETEQSNALGFGLRCGFLGMLHMDIIRERIEREFKVSLIMTPPSVVYRVYLKNRQMLEVRHPSLVPGLDVLDAIHELWVLVRLILPADSLGDTIVLCQDRNGIQKDIDYIGQDRVLLQYEMPLKDMIMDFYDRLKSISHGYATLDYKLLDYRRGDLVRLDVIVNGTVLDSLASVVDRRKSQHYGRNLCEKLKEVIPRQMFVIAIQAAIGKKVIARETLSALRKDVTAKCYGGDVTRKNKLLKKQKEGKKNMRSVGKVYIPKDAFMSLMKLKK